MKVTQTWKRNMPTTLQGESITLTTVYSSFDKSEIDDLEKNMPKGIMQTEYKDRCEEKTAGDNQIPLKW